MAGDLTLDPVTFEVLKNSFITSVDQMGEQVLRTCYSFVIYNHDFSSALHDAKGECAAQGNQDIAVHVGTLPPTSDQCPFDWLKAMILPSAKIGRIKRTSEKCVPPA